jgi:hypothetical protein
LLLINKFFTDLSRWNDRVAGSGFDHYIVTPRVQDLDIEIYEAPSAPAIVVLSEIISNSIFEKSFFFAFFNLVYLTIKTEIDVNRVVLVIGFNGEGYSPSEAI